MITEKKEPACHLPSSHVHDTLPLSASSTVHLAMAVAAVTLRLLVLAEYVIVTLSWSMIGGVVSMTTGWEMKRDQVSAWFSASTVAYNGVPC